MTEITLYNTKTKRKDVLEPINPDNVRMYVCGPTVYDRAHIGNARPVIVFDTLFRLLRHVYGPEHVTYVRNFTDVDDKINATALARKEAGVEGTLEELIAERTKETIEWYHDDMDAVGALRPSVEPRATDYIQQMQDMISELLDKGFAYTARVQMGHNSGAQYVYLDSEKAPSHAFLSVDEYSDRVDESYGSLSGRSIDDMIVGSRAETGEGKRNPMDSVLWKPSTIDQPGWDSPWGFGRPGWHIECSAMARELLGKQFDVHGGGLDLLFPHHENERAHCVACDGDDASASIWMHNEMLQVEGKKMSKSLGNFFTVRDLLDQGVPGEVIRFVFLSTHYRKPMDWTEKKRVEAEKRLAGWFRKTDGIAPASTVPATIEAALADDLNTHLALSEMGKLGAPQLKASLQLLGFPNAEDVDWFRSQASELVGVSLKGEGNLSKLQSALRPIQDHWQALRDAKEYSRADEIKRQLAEMSISLKATASGPQADVEEYKKVDFAKLEGLL